MQHIVLKYFQYLYNIFLMLNNQWYGKGYFFIKSILFNEI